MRTLLQKIVESSLFQNTITGVIVLGGVVVGLETDANIANRYAVLLHRLDQAILGIFVAEILIKLGSHGSRPDRFFRDPWNVFDFVIVAACFLPLAGQYAMVLRLLRLLRVLRLVHALPRLQLLVSALLKSIPSMGYISLFLGLLFYVYAVAAVFLFAKNDPIHFKDLGLSLLTLFRVVTLEDWTDIMYIQMKGCAGYEYYRGNGYESLCLNSEAFPIVGPLFFTSFVLIGTMVILNLFIGVIMNSMNEAQEELENQRERLRMAERGIDGHSFEHLLYEMNQKIQRLHQDIKHIQHVADERGWIEPGRRADQNSKDR